MCFEPNAKQTKGIWSMAIFHGAAVSLTGYGIAPDLYFETMRPVR